MVRSNWPRTQFYAQIIVQQRQLVDVSDSEPYAFMHIGLIMVLLYTTKPTYGT